MRITILTSGSRGDVQPYVALGAGLRRAGHRVSVPAPELFRGLVEGAELDFRPIAGIDPRAFIRRPELQAAYRSGSQWRLMLTIARQVGPILRGAVAEMWQACDRAEAILASGLLFIAADVAEARRVPWLAAVPSPIYPTREFPSPFTPPGLRLGGAYNRLSHVLLLHVFWQAFRSHINHLRRSLLGLPPRPLAGPFGPLRAARIPFLHGYSPALIPRPRDWPAWHHQTGYWFLDQSNDWQPPADLERFLDAGPAPVYVGFGSMDDQNPERITRLVLEALRLCGQRAVLLSGWAGLGGLDLPDTVHLAESVSHTWLFPRMRAVVHHGGAGTTGAGLRAGVPSIVTPFVGDQYFWHKRVVARGVGPDTPPMRRLTAPALAAAINSAVTDPAMRRRAAELGEVIRAEQGVEQAVAVIERTIRSA